MDQIIINPNLKTTNASGFTAADAWPLMGIKDYNKFKNNIVLGKHINEPRLSDNRMILLPVSRNEGSIYENQKNFKHNILNKLNV